MGAPRDFACPAAKRVDPPTHGPSVVCGELQIANRGEHIDGHTARGYVSPFVSGRDEPSTVQFLCGGRGVPGSPACYTNCPIWQAAREADAAARSGPGALKSGAKLASHRTRNPAIDAMVADMVEAGKAKAGI